MDYRVIKRSNFTVNAFFKKTRNRIFLAVAFVIIPAGIYLTVFINNPTTRMVNEVIKAIDSAGESQASMITINNKFTVTQNGKDNININQGVFIREDETKQVGIMADMGYTSGVNPGNNYNLTLDIWKKADTIYEKQGERYEVSSLSLTEFNTAIEDYKIYKVSKSNIQSIESVKSVDDTSTIYQITLKSLDEQTTTQYLEAISSQVGEKFDKSKVQAVSAVLVTSISEGVLKSQQLKFYMKLKSISNEIEMFNVSEININLDADAIHNNFVGRGE